MEQRVYLHGDCGYLQHVRYNNIYGGNIKVEFYIKEIKSISDYYVREDNKLDDNQLNREVKIKITEANEKDILLLQGSMEREKLFFWKVFTRD